jgi:alpha-methylacyl-CoA racemase
MNNSGPLAGLKVVEFAGIGPGPLCGMLLADLGAQVIRIDRPVPSGIGIAKPPAFDLANRGKQTVIADLKHERGIALARRLITKADVLIEGFRPGVMERLGFGPEECLVQNPLLVYGRVTGFGQDGPLAHAAGHDLNYIALTGALHAIGRAGQPPTPPMNLLGDYAGGSLFLAFGIVCALLEARRSGLGQVVDAAMIDGVSALMTPYFGMISAGMHDGPRGTNLLDSGAPYYDVYRCLDGGYVAVAPIEKKFRQVLCERIGLDPAVLANLNDPAQWPQARQTLSDLFLTRSRDDWCRLLEGSDACFAPVLTPAEAPAHPHHRARQTFVEIDGVVQPAPAPRFSRTRPGMPRGPEAARNGGAQWAAEWGVPLDPAEEI